MAALVNHPDLLDTFAEDIAKIDVVDPALDNLRREILKLHAIDGDLDSNSIKNQLKKMGGCDVIQSVLSSEVLIHAGFARKEAPAEEVRTGFIEALTRQLEPVRRAQLEEAKQHFINNPTDENWVRFEKLKSDGSVGR